MAGWLRVLVGRDGCYIYGKAVYDSFGYMNATMVPFKAPYIEGKGAAAADYCRARSPPPWSREARDLMDVAAKVSGLLPSDPEA